MAPFPEEVDVFSGPHSKMKHLVDCYLELLSGTDFLDVEATETLLRSLQATFCVFRSHEQIENEYIMYRLRLRLKTLAVVDPHDSIVCNCHSDNRLAEMLQLVGDGLKMRESCSLAERLHYGRRLKAALADFTRSFLPHMQEEEEVFQPLLIKYFEYDELVLLKDVVTEQHERLDSADKYSSEVSNIDGIKSNSDVTSVTSCNFDRVPPEVILKIFSYLWPPDLGRCTKVCAKWNKLVYQPILWQSILPVNWSRNNWEATYDRHFNENYICSLCDGNCLTSDKNDDENLENELAVDLNCPSRRGLIIKERIVMISMGRFLLPKIGIGVRHMSLAESLTLNGSKLYELLSQCPNLNRLNLSYTRLEDKDILILKWKKSRNRLRLSQLDLSGCFPLSDDSFRWLFTSIIDVSQLNYLSLSGCYRITDNGFRFLYDSVASLPSLGFLDLSGCWNLSGNILTACVRRCPNLKPEKLYYCDHIADGPYQHTANGCQNLESDIRRCCCYKVHR